MKSWFNNSNTTIHRGDGALIVREDGSHEVYLPRADNEEGFDGESDVTIDILVLLQLLHPSNADLYELAEQRFQQAMQAAADARPQRESASNNVIDFTQRRDSHDD